MSRPDGARPLDQDPTARAVEHAQAAAASAGLAAGAAAGAAAQVLSAAGRDVVHAARAGAERLPDREVLEGVLEDALDRGTHAWDALRGRRRHPRRWPWAAGSAAAGAVAAVLVAVAVRRLRTSDAPGAQEPEQVRAVVDPAPAVVPAAHVPPGAAVDEDGEAVEPA